MIFGFGPRTPASQRPERDRRRIALTTLLAGGVLLAPGAAWALPARLPAAQEETTAASRGGSQVIAQGISRLPRGDLAWTVRRLDVPGEEGMAVEEFPLGFAVADGAAVAVLDEEGGALGILDDGEAAFLPSGKGGALASWRDDTAGLYEVALVAAEDAAAGETPGTIVGNPFAAPNGRAFEIELARAALSGDDEVIIPVSPSGAPVLFLVTTGTVQLTPPGGQPVELAAGQFALLLGEVTARGVGDAPTAFVVATIGDAVAAQGAGAEGTPEARADRADRQRDREGGGQGGDGSAKPAKVKKAKAPKGQRTGGGGGGGRQGGGGQGGGGQAQQQQPTGDAGGAPVTGGVEQTPTPGTPAAEAPLEETIPASPTVPTDGTPAPEATLPTDESTVVEGTDETAEEAPIDDAGATETPAVEGIVEGESEPTAETVAPEATLPVDEVPAAEVPAEEAPVEGEPTADPNAAG